VAGWPVDISGNSHTATGCKLQNDQSARGAQENET
jgi:hypothetical protein